MISNNKRIVKNSFFLLSRTIFLTLITLYTLREVISILGADGFGLYTVVFGVVTMFAFINSAMMSATQRYLSFEIGKNNAEDVKKTFLSSILIHAILAITLSIVIFLFKDFFINNVLNVKNFKVEAGYIYNFAIISIFISILQVPFSALITAYEKMQAFAYLAIFEGVSKLLVVYLLLYFNYNKVVLYSLFLTLTNIVIFLLHVFYCKLNFSKVINILSLKFSEVKPLLSGMLGFIGWSLIGNLSVVMRNQGANILLNVFFGLIVNAAFTISMTMMSAISTLVSAVSNAINPQIYKRYAENNIIEFFKIINFGTKYYMYMVSVIVFPLIFCMDYILNLWLKDIPEHTIDFCQIVLILVLVDSFSSLIISAIQATGNIRGTQIFVGSLLLINLPMSFFLFVVGFSEISIFYTSIGVSLAAFFVRMWFFVKLTDYKFNSYIKEVFIPVVFVQILILVFISIWFVFLGKPNDIYDLIIFILLSGCYNISLVYMVGLSQSEKVKLKKMLIKNGKILG